MKRTRLVGIAIGWVLVIAMCTPAQAEQGRAGMNRELRSLVDRADTIYRGTTSAAVFEMEIKTRSYTRSYKVLAWDDSRGTDKSLMRILGPALWRGNSTLKVGDKLKLYNPNTNRVTLVSASMLGNSWMGSHFSNDDLVKETKLARDFTLSLERKTPVKSELGAAIRWRVRLTPKPTAPVAWAKIVYELDVAGTSVVPVRAEYFRKMSQSAPSRVLTFSKVRKLGGRMLPSEMKMTVAKKPGEYTVVRYKKLVLGIKIPSRKFTEQAMRK